MKQHGHRLVATIFEADPAKAVAALQALPTGSDMAELRLDALWPAVPEPEAAADLLLSLADAAPVPMIATLRPVRQGGLFAGDEAARLGLLISAARAGFPYIDLELDIARSALVEELAAVGAQAIVSQHLLGPTPCREDALIPLTAARDAGSAVQKLVLGGHSFRDAMRALETAAQHSQAGGQPVVATMGGGDARFRALLAIAGNHVTYGHAGTPAFAGQPAAADVQRVWDDWGLTRDDLDPVPEGPRGFLAVLGNPVEGSLSPRMHNAALRMAGRRERFGALEVPASRGAMLLMFHAAQRIGMVGASVTMPFKSDAARAAASDATATAVGAANCVRFRAQAEATNTDATAAQRILAPHVDEGVPAIVLGAGGMARAAIHALRNLGAAVRFSSRDAQTASAVAAMGARWVPWTERASLRGPIWVQATPLGLRPGDMMPVAAGQLDSARFVLECNYKGGPTPLLEAARQSGAEVADGRRLVLEQAIDAQRFWFGAEPDRQAMERASGLSPDALAAEAR